MFVCDHLTFIEGRWLSLTCFQSECQLSPLPSFLSFSPPPPPHPLPGEVSSEPQTLSRCEEGAGEGRGELELNQTGNHFPLDPTQPWPGECESYGNVLERRLIVGVLLGWERGGGGRGGLAQFGGGVGGEVWLGDRTGRCDGVGEEAGPAGELLCSCWDLVTELLSVLGDDTDSSIQARHKTRAAQPTSPARVSPAPARACPPPRTPRPRPSHTESFEQLMSGSTEPAQQRLEVKLLKLCPPSPELQTSFRESYNVYKRYQMHVHKDTEEMASEAEYRRFFCSTPLLGEEPVDGPDTGYGSFIEQFLLDGKIIALGLLDILPEGINSQYLCYDPAYSFLSLGVYSALREIALTQRLHKKAPRMKYYYLGPYVHSCIKVKYKLQYQPAELLCPVTGRWVFAEKCLSKLEESKYTRLYEREDADVVSGLSDEDLWFFRNFLDALSPSPSASLQTEEAMLVVSQEDLVSTHSSQGWWRQHSCLARFLSCCCVTCRRRETQS
uniref:Arginyl-tRNA--protein transferase 1-like n=1 Tax=Callorhinchus milii TaxID=7868 RepID=A0A4W3HJI9_CALMI